MGMIKRVYLCDMKKECSDRPGCARNGGECKHTTERSHARNGAFTIEERDGELIIPDNVEVIRRDDGDMILVEVEEVDE